VSDRDGGARRIGLLSAAALVIGNMIGVGVFTTSGFALADLGQREWVLLAWLVGGLLAMCGALSYGALARRIPESGGEYTFLSQTIHPLAGFLAGWISLVAGFTAPIAASALGLQAYLVGSGDDGARPEWIGTAAILVAGLMHGLRLREGVVLQNLAVGLKLLAIAVLVVFAAGQLPVHGLEPSGPGNFKPGAFAVTLVWISFAYSGWNATVYVAGEVRDPDRNLHRSLIFATLLVTLVYLALNAVFLYGAPASVLAGKAEVGAIAAEAIGGPRLRQAMSVLVALALFTSISAMVMAGPRVYARMAEDGLFPRIFGREGDVPARAVALQVGLAILVLWYSDLAKLIGYIGFTLGLSAAATVAGLIAMRIREGRERVPIPGYPWIPGLFVFVTLGTAGFMILRQPGEAVTGLLTVAVGALLYFVLPSRGARKRGRSG
jgi:APA family basic amino acid/polyamine antiporter